MPVNISTGETVADIHISNSSRLSNLQDVSSGIDQDAATTAIPHSRNAASQMAVNRNHSNLQNEGDRNQRSKEQTSPLTKTGRQNSDSLLQIPSETLGPRPVAPIVWDWDTDLDIVGESDNYYYEPQGELLQVEQKDHGQSRDEFNIPYAVVGPGVQWNVEAPTADEEGFVVPRRPSTISQALIGNKRKSQSENPGGSKQPEPKRTSRVMSDTTEGESPLAGTASTSSSTRPQAGPASRLRSQTDTAETRPRSEFPSLAGGRPGHGPTGLRRTLTDPSIPMVLPARKVFPIQIGDKLFRLSGASISSDAPSYFSQFFEEQLRQNEGADSVRTLYIDRDPTTFEDISLHLQGYHIEPRDGPHFVKLFADAQFFSLPRLTAQLFASTIYIRIGDEEFQIPRDLFSNPGDSPNYFSLGFSIFFTSPTEVFPGLSQRTLLRPPSILPPSIPNRSAKTFADLLHILKGYPVEVRSEEHRAELLRDARYFHLKGLEQRLIPHSISFNLARKRSEMVIRLEDVRQSGISFVADGQAPPQAPPPGQSPASPASSTTASSTPYGPGWIYYQRPYVDSEAYSLILEIGGDESTYLAIAPGAASAPARIGRAIFHKQTLARITSLFSVIANKMNLPITQPLGLMMMERGAGVASLPVSPGNTGVSEEKVKVRVGQDADVVVDGEKWTVNTEDDEENEDEDSMDVEGSEAPRPRKRRRTNEQDEGEDWVVRKAQWRLRVQPMSGGQSSGKSGMEVILGAVKIEAYSNERARNATRGFLV